MDPKRKAHFRKLILADLKANYAYGKGVCTPWGYMHDSAKTNAILAAAAWLILAQDEDTPLGLSWAQDMVLLAREISDEIVNGETPAEAAQ